MTKEKLTVQKRQTMRFNDAELSLIKNTFAENDELLKALRKVFLQMELTVTDKAVLNVFHSEELLAVVRKAWLPSLDANAPAHQLIDLYMTVDIKDKTPQEAFPHIVARQIVIEYLEQQLETLQTLDTLKEERRFTSLIPSDVIGDEFSTYVNLTARNIIIAHTEMQLEQMRVLAGQKDETLEETQRRLQSNSSK